MKHNQSTFYIHEKGYSCEDYQGIIHRFWLDCGTWMYERVQFPLGDVNTYDPTKY